MNLAVIVSILSLCVALFVAITGYKRNQTADDKRVAAEETTLIVKLETIGNDVKEIKSDMRNMRNDIQDLRDRLIVVEQSTKSAHHRLDEMEKAHETRHGE